MTNSRRHTALTAAAAAAFVAILGVRSADAQPPTTAEITTIEQNKATARRWSEELWSRGDLTVADDIIAPDYLRHDPGDPFPARGPQDVKRIVTMLRSMLADFTITVESMVAEGDMVVSRYTATATDSRGYMGLPPTGKAIRTPAIQIFRFANGKIVESWAARDDLGTLQQLGHLPPLGPDRTKAQAAGK